MYLKVEYWRKWFRNTGNRALFCAHSSYRTTTGKRSIIAYPTVSNQSPISVQTGVVIADICFRWAERTPGDAPNAILPVTPTVLIWCPTFVVCLWRRPTLYYVTGRTSIKPVVDAPLSKSRRRQGTVLKRSSRTLVHLRYQRLPQISAPTWVDSNWLLLSLPYLLKPRIMGTVALHKVLRRSFVPRRLYLHICSSKRQAHTPLAPLFLLPVHFPEALQVDHLSPLNLCNPMVPLLALQPASTSKILSPIKYVCPHVYLKTITDNAF